MPTDPTVRIVWFEGRPHPVSAYPAGVAGGGTHWYVQTRDGEWHKVIRRSGDISTKEDGARLESAIATWLEEYYTTGGGPPQ